jgi:methylmalonyl-CoA mutase N-terminal domain/subunit
MAESTTNIPIMKIDDSIQTTQVERLTQFKAARNQDSVKEHLQRIVDTAKGSNNLMPVVIDAVEAHCTLGEIAHALRGVWGEFKG